MTFVYDEPLHLPAATHIIAQGAVDAWLGEHGIDSQDVLDAGIEIGRRAGVGRHVVAWLLVTYYLRDPQGRRYAGADGESVATGTITIPLRSFPVLTAAGDGEAGS